MDIISVISMIFWIVLAIVLIKLRTRKPSKLSRKQKRIRLVIIIIVVAAVFVLVDIFGPIWGGQIKFYAKWIECGQLPQQEDNGGGFAPKNIRSYEQAPAFTILRFNSIEYFCTPKEAELKAYSSDPNTYSFPHLSQEERDRL